MGRPRLRARPGVARTTHPMLSTSLARRLLTPEAKRRLRVINRVRWIAKTRQVRAYGSRRRTRPAELLRYVLWDPEVGDFSYDLANRDEFAMGMAGALGVSPSDVQAWFAEAEAHPEIAVELRRRLRRRLDLHRRPEFGPRLGWYAAVRAIRPGLVVETGIKHGIGSLLLLVALEVNRSEGHPGELISIDDDPAAGSLVPAGRFGHWTKITGRSPDDLRPHLDGRAVDLLIHDTPPIAELEAAEYALALEHGAPGVWLMSGGNGDVFGALDRVARAAGSHRTLVRELADHPVCEGSAVGIARIPPQTRTP